MLPALLALTLTACGQSEQQKPPEVLAGEIAQAWVDEGIDETVVATTDVFLRVPLINDLLEEIPSLLRGPFEASLESVLHEELKSLVNVQLAPATHIDDAIYQIIAQVTGSITIDPPALDPTTFSFSIPVVIFVNLDEARVTQWHGELRNASVSILGE